MIGRGIPNKYKLFLMAFPFLVLTFIFSYLPLSGWLYAFYDYMPGIPLSKTPFVGFKWFHTMPAVYAILLSEVKTAWYRKMVQTLTTIPNFISWILVYSLAFALLSVDSGLVNSLFRNCMKLRYDRSARSVCVQYCIQQQLSFCNRGLDAEIHCKRIPFIYSQWIIQIVSR
jgi:ABC-type polysaccharide transport system permease subunit